MKFNKIVFASLLALLLFSLVVFATGYWLISHALKPSKPDMGSNAVLVLDLSKNYQEQGNVNPLGSFTSDHADDIPGLYDVVKLLRYAKTDPDIEGIYIKADYNANGFGSTEELHKAILDFMQSKKFVIAYGATIDEKSYYVATAANKIYCQPNGGVEWDGYYITWAYYKGLLDKLGVEAQVLYAGRFKNASEPYRVTKMTDANRLQTTDILIDLYGSLLEQTAKARNIDTATLHQLAINGSIRTANDALKYKLVDGLKYDDEVKAELSDKLHQPVKDKINFVTLGTYAKVADLGKKNGDSKIAVIYAQGEIVAGKSQYEEVGSEDFVSVLRKVRLDNEVKAIVFRVNSPGGSALASDAIWREITLAKKEKPVIVSMGDFATSGGYYISCNADSIFADESTITGSVGVWSIYPNVQRFLDNKLGITFDGVTTAPYADMGSFNRPLTETEKRFLQGAVDTIYNTFKQRVADGRKIDMAFVDSIAQGHVYSGKRAIGVKLVDKTGTLQDAVDCAARMAKLTTYRTEQYPEKKSWLEQLMSRSAYKTSAVQGAIKESIGEQQFKLMQQIMKLQQLMRTPQTRLPFDFSIN